MLDAYYVVALFIINIFHVLKYLNIYLFCNFLHVNEKFLVNNTRVLDNSMVVSTLWNDQLQLSSDVQVAIFDNY